jgi:hypothetical protein
MKRSRFSEEQIIGILKERLAQAMVDVSTLRQILGKTSKAQFEEICRKLGHHREGLFPKARMPTRWDRCACLPASFDAGR